MKKIIPFFLFMHILCLASDSEELFLKANELYLQKKYAKSYQLYKMIKNKNSAIWYNMGNCAYKNSEYVNAIVYWSKARKNSAQRKLIDIEYNIYLARKKLGCAILSKTFYEEMYDFCNKVYSPFSLFGLQLLFLVFWFGFVVLFVKLNIWRFLFLGSLLFINVFLGIGLFTKYRFYQTAIIGENKVKFFAGPDTKFHKVGDLFLADEVVIKQKSENWYKISHNGRTGWLLSDSLKII